jgi:hypothetical protein
MWQRNWRLDSRYCTEGFQKFWTATRSISVVTADFQDSIGLVINGDVSPTIKVVRNRERSTTLRRPVIH